jgi:hypothetical protein
MSRHDVLRLAEIKMSEVRDSPVPAQLQRNCGTIVLAQLPAIL